MTETVRVLRVVEYVGERSWVEEVVANSIHGEKRISRTFDHGKQVTGGVIKVATLGTYPEILDSPQVGKQSPDLVDWSKVLAPIQNDIRSYIEANPGCGHICPGTLSPEDAFQFYCEWNGLVHWATALRTTLDMLYGRVE